MTYTTLILGISLILCTSYEVCGTMGDYYTRLHNAPPKPWYHWCCGEFQEAEEQAQILSQEAQYRQGLKVHKQKTYELLQLTQDQDPQNTLAFYKGVLPMVAQSLTDAFLFSDPSQTYVIHTQKRDLLDTESEQALEELIQKIKRFQGHNTREYKDYLSMELNHLFEILLKTTGLKNIGPICTFYKMLVERLTPGQHY